MTRDRAPTAHAHPRAGDAAAGMASWAKHLRVIKVEFSPFTSGRTPAAFFGYAASSKVRAAAPKLQLEKKLLPRTSDAQLLHLTFVDGATKTCAARPVCITCPARRPCAYSPPSPHHHGQAGREQPVL